MWVVCTISAVVGSKRMKRFVRAVDLVTDEDGIAAYDKYHREVWPSVKASLYESGIKAMSIYRFANRLVMILDANDDFTFERKLQMDEANEDVVRWETIMRNYQRAIPGSEGQLWVPMEEVFRLD